MRIECFSAGALRGLLTIVRLQRPFQLIEGECAAAHLEAAQVQTCLTMGQPIMILQCVDMHLHTGGTHRTVRRDADLKTQD